jgi:subtilisin family serine protease
MKTANPTRTTRFAENTSFVLTLLVSLIAPATPAAWCTQKSAQIRPLIQSFAPTVAGVGGQLKLDGLNLGSESGTVVVFNSSVIAEQVDEHTPTEIIARVPLGALTGPLVVVSGVDASTLRLLQSQIELLQGIDSQLIQQQLQELEAQKRKLLAQGTPSSDTIYVSITFGFLTTTRSEIGPVVEDSEGLPYLVGRVIVDLKGVQSFDVALNIAAELDADLTGYFPASNSYVLDLRNPPSGLDGLDEIVHRLDADPRVQEAWEDMVLQPQQVKFADVDVVDRYRRTKPRDKPTQNSLDGRVDVWTTDRIQAPGAWNLLERFIPVRDGKAPGRASLFPMKVAVLDTGVDQRHPEFNGVPLKKVGITYTRFKLPGVIIDLPSAIGDTEDYTDGDFRFHGVQHGTAVTSLIGAANGAVIPGAANTDGDRGINGLLHNPMQYTIQVGRFFTDCDLIAGLNSAALTAARVVNLSGGQDHPVNPDKGNFFRVLQLKLQLKVLAANLSQFQNDLLLVAAAGNNGSKNDPDDLHGRVLGLDEKNLPNLPPGGLDVPASLGTLPNVIAVASINENDQLSYFSNWGTPVQIGAPGEGNFMAGECQDEAAGKRCDFHIGDAYYMKRQTGTSFAAPQVSGTAALLLGVNPSLTAAQLKNYVASTAFFVNTNTLAKQKDDTPFVLKNWPTLKTAFAIRQAMLDTPAARFGSQAKGNLIKNDQLWTGISKIAYYSRAPMRTKRSTLRFVEIRRGGDSRSEAFAARDLQLNDGPAAPDTWNASLTHDGRWIAFVKDNQLKVFKFESSIVSSGPIDGITLNQRALQIGPGGEFLLGASAPIAGFPTNCFFRLLWLPPDRKPKAIAVASTYAKKCGANEHPTVNLDDVQWTPDNRNWDLLFEAGNKTDSINEANLSQTLKKLVLITFPAKPLEPLGRRQAHSTDGMGWAYEFLGDLQPLVTFYRPLELHEAAIPDKLVSITWAPDGSELSYSTEWLSPSTKEECVACIVTMRRDFRDKSDRQRKIVVQSDLKRILSIESVSWQW